MRDLVVKLLALAGFIGFLVTLAIYVPDMDLILVIALVSAMALFDMLVRPVLLRRRRRVG
jgi:hypothetical protein